MLAGIYNVFIKISDKNRIFFIQLCKLLNFNKKPQVGILQLIMGLLPGSKNRNFFRFFCGSFARFSFLYLIISVVFLFTYFPDSRGQHTKSLAADILYKYFNTLYGLDQNLINGVKFYKSPEAVSGNEFFLNDKPSPGRITVNGIMYPNVFLKYDLVKQDVILEYNYPSGGKMQIIIDKEKITEFEIFNKTFKKYYFPSTGELFFQTLTAGDLVCLIYWQKILVPSTSSLQYVYIYSEEYRKTYLLFENKLCKFAGQRSFLKLFPEYGDEIKKFIKRHQLEIRNISDDDLVRLLEYCNGLSSDVKADTSQ